MRSVRPAKTWIAVAVIATAALLGTGAVSAAGKKCGGLDVTHQGTSGDDVITGTDGPDVVWAGAGNDEIDTGLDEDVVCAGSGRDRVNTGGQGDRVWAGAGNDSVTAFSGDDLVYGEDGADRILGGDQTDELHGHAGPDYINAGDSRTGRGEGDFAYGGLGRDRMKAFGSDDGAITLYGNKGDDTLFGEGKHHVLDGGPGTDACSPEGRRRNCERKPEGSG